MVTPERRRSEPSGVWPGKVPGLRWRRDDGVAGGTTHTLGNSLLNTSIGLSIRWDTYCIIWYLLRWMHVVTCNRRLKLSIDASFISPVGSGNCTIGYCCFNRMEGRRCRSRCEYKRKRQRDKVEIEKWAFTHSARLRTRPYNLLIYTGTFDEKTDKQARSRLAFFFQFTALLYT